MTTKTKKAVLVAYTSRDETLVCAKSMEAKMLREWFVECDRDVDDYDRRETADVVQIRAGLRIDL